jgi:hypothetical protein
MFGKARKKLYLCRLSFFQNKKHTTYEEIYSFKNGGDGRGFAGGKYEYLGTGQNL